MNSLLVLVIGAAVVISLALAAANFFKVKQASPGTESMQQIASAIKDGANAFMSLQYRAIALIAIIILAIMTTVVSWQAGIAFIFGGCMSAIAGWIGMHTATLANVRVSNMARESKSLGKTLQLALMGGSVMGLAVAGFALLGLAAVYIVFGYWLGQLSPGELVLHDNWLGIPGIRDIPFTMTVSGYALGCSLIDMFNRVGGGIYTKAADMGADLVGKTEIGIPEDDPRNPATIADNVGDNVGDVAGLGSDLLESFVGALVSAVILAAYLFFTHNGRVDQEISHSTLLKLVNYPLVVAAAGLLSCSLGIVFMRFKRISDHPHKEMNLMTWASAILTLGVSGIASIYVFRNVTDAEFKILGFVINGFSPWGCAVLGVASGIYIGHLAERYTSYDYPATKRVSELSREGPALTITQGMAAGMKSVLAPVFVLAVAIIGSHALAGLYGVAMAAIGMLSFVAVTVSVDTYGPIADNAGGLSEMAKLDHKVREITDSLDAVGNTPAAIGKGFAIGSAALAALSLFASYVYAQAGEAAKLPDFNLVLNMINTLTLAGAAVGAALPYLFSGILIEAVAAAARKMVQEVRRQFADNPDIITGKSLPNYRECIEISSAGALHEMKLPALIAVLAPIVCGLLFGPEFVGGLLIGTTLSSVVLALFTANAGGAWDNGKKYIENGHFGGRGSEAHKAAVVGDTVGDPLKDTVGPSLDILIKIMAVISLIMVSIFGKYNLYGWLMGQ
ncbi:MAG: sodium-translocating pyrophosphatase [Lentisphaerae bacterium]|nr:sodium-translocating pyrophosphatase [Lentisphaerota bacterium]